MFCFYYFIVASGEAHVLLLFLFPSLLFTVAPVVSPFQFDGPLNAGDSAILTCYVPQGDRPLKIKWYHNGRHITHHSKGISTSAFGSQASILNINHVEPHHRGEYSCLVTNVAGKSKFTAFLNVNGRSI